MRLILTFALCLVTAAARAESALVAVATNFHPAAEELAEAFTAETGHDLRLTAGATGKLAAQIANGAPFDAFLSADTETPLRLAAEGHALADTGFTYATGALLLWSADPARDLSDPAAAIEAARHVAIANPALAPYGKAAMQVIEKLHISTISADKIVTGENIGQAYALAASGAADIGFIAASALPATGTAWPVPQNLHDPILQDAILLAHGADNQAARAFLDWLHSDPARTIIRSHGYEAGE
ncbi:molybdate ABC transporter substrate-binding protein [Defluviimonas aestuarii]|uniref:molybdate ABC transporter substrate-binding protein n=1 Tax=Albidovulum aestuarii TaxID=1130726 RepID=UPI00249C0EA6|nr:molybdate ABC transporter substrate-binding protein [Defluviimonas aestuarii]MDI3336054.1 molybdate ABC transporter substrate-binding protein [Defluviimonas aestuarii]